MTYQEFFRSAYGKLEDPRFQPFDYQCRLASEAWPDLLGVPTGMGKTAGIVLAWLWKRGWRQDERAESPETETPRRLVYCLPMRVLVEQTYRNIETWLRNLEIGGQPGRGKVSVHLLMGGSEDVEKATWAAHPEEDMVLIGTQDMLLSRALNRGYGMNRFEWPMHFGLLNQDCLWVMDEIQLMGPGLWTSAQLDWMRRKRFPALMPCRTLWMSATIGTSFLKTTDRKKDSLDQFKPFDPGLDKTQTITSAGDELKRRQRARRPVTLFKPEGGKKALPLDERIAEHACKEHGEGTLTLVICNTVQMAQDVFRCLADDGTPKILLTSRLRGCDRQNKESTLSEFEARRSKAANGRIDGDPGLICVSTQVVEAGIDISAHRLWSELAPWPSMIQRLGRLNRDGRDNDAKAYVWEQLKPEKWKHDGESWIGPYREKELKDAKVLLNALTEPSAREPLAQAVAELKNVKKESGKIIERALEPQFEPHPRALDVHGLFSTEPDMHGGFTDVSRFVRGDDPDADVTVFWRNWSGGAPPEGDDLDGPAFDSQKEGCAVAVSRLKTVLKSRNAKAWIWSTRNDRWESRAANELTPGMVVMLHANVGGYSANLGWTGKAADKLQNLPPPGPGGALRRDERVFVGYWAPLNAHLRDARSEAKELCDRVGLVENNEQTRDLRTAVIEGAGLHDLGKLHPDWQASLPAGDVIGEGPWAKAPYVLRVEPANLSAETRAEIEQRLPGSLALAPRLGRDGQPVGLLWAIDRKLKRDEIDKIRSSNGVNKAVHEAFRPGLRHEAASALAMWRRYRDGAPYPALAVYLAAAHHGKVRTVLRSIKDDGDDVFGVSPDSEAFKFNNESWPMDFSVAADGAEGEWTEEGFVLTGHGWTGLVADLLGSWRVHSENGPALTVVPRSEPHHLGPFVLAWLEALVRVADWRASDPEIATGSIKPSEVSDGK